MASNNTPYGYWDYNNCLIAFKKCSSLKQLRVEQQAALSAALKKGFYDKLIKESGIKRERRRRFSLTKEYCHKIALKYNTRSEFRQSNESAYIKAWRKGWLDFICSHMKFLSGNQIRYLYAYEYSDKSVYVGLTWNYKQRHNSHIRSNKILNKKKEKI